MSIFFFFLIWNICDLCRFIWSVYPKSKHFHWNASYSYFKTFSVIIRRSWSRWTAGKLTTETPIQNIKVCANGLVIERHAYRMPRRYTCRAIQPKFLLRIHSEPNRVYLSHNIIITPYTHPSVPIDIYLCVWVCMCVGAYYILLVYYTLSTSRREIVNSVNLGR